MGSPLVVELAEIRVADVENTALTTYKDPPNTYRHFVDDGIGDFRDKSHADGFLNYLNSLTDDLQYTIEYPSHDGSLPYMDILNPHPRRQIHICLQKTYTHQPLCPLQFLCPSSYKDSVIRSLTRRAHVLCSPQHLQKWTPP